jgi:hypothetical protein
MPFVTKNGYQIPLKGTLDSENPNYADQYQTLITALLEHKSASSGDLALFVPQNGSLYYTTSGVTIADGDFKAEIETATGDLVQYLRRTGVWEEYDRTHINTTHASRTFNGETVFTHVAEVESDDGNIFVTDTNDENRVATNVVIQNVTNLAPGESSAGCPVIINTQGSAGTADSTSLMQGIPFVVSGEASAETVAMNVRPGWTSALKVNGSQGQSLTAGYSYDNSVLTDRTTAFNTAGTDVQLFTNDNDTILIGFSSPFSIIELNLAIAAAQDIQATYRYSTGNDTWAALTIGSDTSTGFSLLSGQIRFNEPGTWATSNLYNGNAITAAYYVEITRTRNGLSTPPTESKINIYQDVPSSDFLIRGNGTIAPVSIADADAQNVSIYYSTDANKLVFKDSAGTVNALY